MAFMVLIQNSRDAKHRVIDRAVRLNSFSVRRADLRIILLAKQLTVIKRVD